VESREQTGGGGGKIAVVGNPINFFLSNETSLGKYRRLSAGRIRKEGAGSERSCSVMAPSRLKLQESGNYRKRQKGYQTGNAEEDTDAKRKLDLGKRCMAPSEKKVAQSIQEGTKSLL